MRAQTGRLVLVALLAAAAEGAEAQSIEAGASPAVPQPRRRGLSLWEAQVAGAAAGLCLVPHSLIGRSLQTPPYAPCAAPTPS